MSACALLLSIGASLVPGAPAPDALDDLLAGVGGIASPGVPGGVCAFGSRAFVVATAANGVPVVAGAEAGD
ncbi:MAG: hypothetical protein O7B99_01315, partial [Planctomycetota bacterium]|nr:hypothetical protein [Planctomycetota bacterium]